MSPGQIQQLDYVDAIITETLRLYPPVPKNIKWSVKDDVLPDGTRVNGSSWVAHCPYTMGRMESLWGPDAHRFDPCRHLGPAKTRHPSPYTFTAFHAGPRICPGQQLAYIEAKYILVKLVMNYHVEVINPCDVVPAQDLLTLAMKNGLKLKLTRRQRC